MKGKEIIYKYEEHERWESYSMVGDYGGGFGWGEVGQRKVKYLEPVLAWDLTV